MSVPIEYIPNFIENPDEVFNTLWAELPWVRMGSTPRFEYHTNDFNLDYTYGTGRGERTYPSQPCHPVITEIRAKLEALTGTKFEVCFANGYESQNDSLGWHADDSPEMCDARPIAIVSIGAERDIMFAPNENRADITRLKLQHGSLCLMLPGMQDTHVHRIPKAGFVCGKRVSLTYRGYVAPVGA